MVKPQPSGATGRLKLPNLKDIQSGEFVIKSEEAVEATSTTREKFSRDDFMNAWEKCKEVIKKKNQSSLNVMLQGLQLEEIDIENWNAVFPNKIQHDLFMQEKLDIMTSLRESLQNYFIEIHTEIQIQQEEYRPYTGAEKFRAMAEKNPVIIELQERLGLDLS